ncbi:MAG: YraN family protein [Limnothrix sp. RL_2_0]|nr:YraN family protein [Limnothrix sp. RL_2_0]
MPKPRPIRKADHLEIGRLGENFVKAHLEKDHWQILAERWHCRWGELDLVVVKSAEKILSFVEVKTRRQNSLDQQGILAITLSKQRKIIKAAMQFLAEFPEYENYGCRFDVALVTHQVNSLADEQFLLEQYLESAFEVDEF